MERRFRRANIGLAVLHGAMIAVLAPFLARASSTDLFLCTARATDETRRFFETYTLDCRQEGRFHVGVPIIVEGIFTASAHALYAVCSARFMAWSKQRNINFWVEYSVSATIIFLVVQTFTGLLQPQMYVQNAFSLVAMMFVPIAGRRKSKAAAIVGMGIYAAVTAPMIYTVAATSRRGDIPAIGLAMFSMLLVLYSTFPAVYYWAEYRGWSRHRKTAWFLGLSLLSKTVLRGLIAGAISQ